MFFRQVLHPDLGCASYVIADGGVAAVVDPKWEIEDYLALADEHGFEIRHVLETHNHADHVSGRGRLAAATGATIHVSPTPGVEYPHETLADGEALELGSVRIEALATPGHRPEHVAYLVTDRSRGEEPYAVLTGDSLFVGDVARPDLAVEAEEGARDLFRSLHRLLELPDHVQVFPGHIGGSLCGGAGMSEAPGSTIGFERRLNALLGVADEDEFVRRATGDLGEQPPNFRRIVELNRGPLLTEAAPAERLEPARVDAILREGATLVDGRAPREWAAAHVPGSVSVTAVRATVGTRAAAAVDPASPVVVTATSEGDAARMVRLLEAVGFRDVRGIVAGGVQAWREAGLRLAAVESIDPPMLAERLRRGEVSLLDVRDPDEWRSGHVEGSLHVPASELPAKLEGVRSEVDGLPLAVACAAGNRSAVAVSLLERAGFDRLVHVGDGGVSDLADHDIDLTKEDASQ
jgi:hydroxyacylglutathione hydrolase